MTSHGSAYNKVLVIDDNETDRYIASRNLRKYAFADEIVTISSAKEALIYLKSFTNNPELLPNFIFLDIRMPEMDGFEFLEQYAKLSEVIKLNSIIMMLTTSLNEEDHEKAKNNKYVKRFMNKPLDKENLESLKHDYMIEH